MLTINNKTITKIAIIDDKDDARDAMADSVEDAEFEPILDIKELKSIDKNIKEIRNKADAAIFDYYLRTGNFANFNGAEVVSRLYTLQFPALLVTIFSRVETDEIRLFRRNIPVLIPGLKVESDIIIEGIKKCMYEFINVYSEDRKAYRTLIRIEKIDKNKKIAFAVIPAWNPNLVVSIPLQLIPANLIRGKPIIRLFADINIAAEKYEDLFFENFTIAEKPKGEYANLLRS